MALFTEMFVQFLKILDYELIFEKLEKSPEIAKCYN